MEASSRTIKKYGVRGAMPESRGTGQYLVGVQLKVKVLGELFLENVVQSCTTEQRFEIAGTHAHTVKGDSNAGGTVIAASKDQHIACACQ